MGQTSGIVPKELVASPENTYIYIFKVAAITYLQISAPPKSVTVL